MGLLHVLESEQIISRHEVVTQGYSGGHAALVGQQYVVQGNQPTVLILTEKKISLGTDSNVTNQQGQVWTNPSPFRIQGRE